MSNQNYFFWCCFPAFEIVTHFMLFNLVNMRFFWMPSLYQKWRGAALQGWPSWEVNEIANICHDLGLWEKHSVAQDDQRAQYYRFGITFPILGRQLTKFRFSSIYCHSASDTEYCDRYKDLTHGSCSPQGHLQISNVRQEITSSPKLWV